MSDLRKHPLSPLLVRIYEVLGGKRRRSVAKLVFKLLFRLEGGQYRSASVRALLARDYCVEVDAHSYGECFVPGAFAPSVKVGKFVSIARDVRVFTQNHPIDRLSSHPYFYERGFGVVESDQLEPSESVIGHDVWIGQGAIILPGCKRVGSGAIIGAGAVVTKSVPDYAIVTGNPAKIIRYRFDEDTIASLLDSLWWERPFNELVQFRKDFCVSVADLEDNNPILHTPAQKPD
ncbi:MAG: CatB-related O-acetyltransferase [Pseudomonadota bacterium]|nr:CatB-related O-acetyltransferase [Pseudomonadota bacterium]